MNATDKRLLNWWENERDRIFIISGFAGCGKTHRAKTIPDFLEVSNYVFLAPTGKASMVLSDEAMTIHRYLYDVSEDIYGNLRFTKKNITEFNEDLIIVDEISMVNDKLLDDLISLEIPIVGLGDPAQLPPVNGDASILENPDIFLKKVWRNDGGILDLSQDIRNNQLKYVNGDYDNVHIGGSLIEHLDKIDDDTIIICRFNNSRRRINDLIREEVYKFNTNLDVGDKLINLKNNYDTGLMNGTIFKVTEIINLGYDTARIRIDTGQVIDIDLNIIKGEKEKKYSKNHQVDYAYAITCHKAQGSEFYRVIVINEGTSFEDHYKWLYTAVTRARKELYIF